MNNFGFRAFVANYNGVKLSPKSIVQARKILFKRGMFYKFQKKNQTLLFYSYYFQHCQSPTVNWVKSEKWTEQQWFDEKLTKLSYFLKTKKLCKWNVSPSNDNQDQDPRGRFSVKLSKSSSAFARYLVGFIVNPLRRSPRILWVLNSRHFWPQYQWNWIVDS